MAGSGTAQRRVNQRSDYKIVQYRVNGTEAYAPQPVTVRRRREVQAASEEVVRNRKKALAVNRAYVIFLTFIAAATVLMCVHYLRLKETITAQVSANEKLESRLFSLRSENDALLECIDNEINWDYIRDVAVNKLGMKYATEEQIVWYNTDDSYYMKQYRDVGKG